MVYKVHGMRRGSTVQMPRTVGAKLDRLAYSWMGLVHCCELISARLDRRSSVVTSSVQLKSSLQRVPTSGAAFDIN